jgi:hypothetical protein
VTQSYEASLLCLFFCIEKLYNGWQRVAIPKKHPQKNNEKYSLHYRDRRVGPAGMLSKLLEASLPVSAQHPRQILESPVTEELRKNYKRS